MEFAFGEQLSPTRLLRELKEWANSEPVELRSEIPALERDLARIDDSDSLFLDSQFKEGVRSYIYCRLCHLKQLPECRAEPYMYVAPKTRRWSADGPEKDELVRLGQVSPTRYFWAMLKELKKDILIAPMVDFLPKSQRSGIYWELKDVAKSASRNHIRLALHCEEHRTASKLSEECRHVAFGLSALLALPGEFETIIRRCIVESRNVVKARIAELTLSRNNSMFLDLIVDIEKRTITSTRTEKTINLTGKSTPWTMFLALYQAGSVGLSANQMKQSCIGEWDNHRATKSKLNTVLKPLLVRIAHGEWRLVNT